MENIKIVSMDFDGTLLTSNKKITDRTRKSLMDLKDRSYIIIGITARNLLSVKDILDVNMFDYIILNNGADIYYVSEDRIESISSIDYETAKELFDLYNNKSSEIDFCTAYKYLIKTEERRDSRSFVKYIDGIEDVDSSISRMNIFFENDTELEENKSVIENRFPNLVVVKMLDTDRTNSRKWITINPNNVNKLHTLKKVCNELKCSIEEVIFFGDGENDLALIENVGISIAMENAIDIVKQKADFTTLSNDNEGVAEFLEKNFE